MKSIRRGILFGATVAAAVVLSGGPAAATVGTSASMTLPVAVAVGQTNLAGSFTMVNTNTAPNQAESNTVNEMRLALSCGSAPGVGEPCPTPDPGVFSVNSPATGAPGTACAGINFTASAPDASGSVTFTPNVPVVLGPPGGAAGSDRCTVNFKFNVLKLPTIDVNAAAGVQTNANLWVRATSSSGLVNTVRPSIQVTVNRAAPSLTTQVAATSVLVGATISDTATVTGVSGTPAPTGTVTFRVWGPNDATCTGPVFAQSTGGLVPASPTSATAGSSPSSVNQPGVYRYTATYSGDANYSPVTAPCGAPNETVNVTTAPVDRPVNDFDGNGTTDVAVFRPSTGSWYLRTPTPSVVAWGQDGDIPVPGDYNGDGITDIAVFRPSNNAWYIRTPTPQFVVWGGAGDIPVPADYDGNGTTDIATFRPATGTWYLRTTSPTAVVWGQNGDIPVPGDYDGNGTVDIAVFRPSNNAWYIRTPTPQFVVWGQAGDIPTPGDYDGNGTTDVAVFHPATGTWYLRTASPTAVVWGQNGDVPAPGDYDGNGITDVAVFRPGNSAWYLRTPTPQFVVWGQSGDLALSLPDAIRRFF